MSNNNEFYINTELNTDGVKEGAQEINKTVEEAAESASKKFRMINGDLVDITGKTEEEVKALVKASEAASTLAKDVEKVNTATNKNTTNEVAENWIEVGNSIVNVEGMTQEEINALIEARTQTQALADDLSDLSEENPFQAQVDAMQDVASDTQRLQDSLAEFFGEKETIEVDTDGALDLTKTDIDMSNLDKYLESTSTLDDHLSNLKANIIDAFTPLRNYISEHERLANTVILLKNSVSNFGNTTKKVFRALAVTSLNMFSSGLKKLGGLIQGLGKKMLDLHKKHATMNGGFKNGLRNLIKYGLGITTLVMLFNRLRKAITEGMQNLARYDKDTNASISSFTSALATLKNALATAFAPILNVVSPILTAFIEQLISATNTIGMLIARLTGQSTFIKATAVQKNYAASLDKTTQSAKRQTLAIDELNQSVDNTSSGGGGGSDVGSMFEEVPITGGIKNLADEIKKAWLDSDFYDFGKGIADKINLSLQSIDWETIRGTASKLGTSLATFLNGIFEEKIKGDRGYWSLGYTIGYTIGQAINTGIDFLYSLSSELHWKSVGQFIADGVKGSLETIEWRRAATTISNFVNGFLDILITFFDDDALWADFGAAIAEFISGIKWKETLFKLGDLAKAFGKAVKNAISGWIKTNPDSFNFAVNVGLTIIGVKLLTKALGSMIAAKMASAVGGTLTAGGAAAGGASLGTVLIPFAIAIGLVAFIENFEDINNAIDGLFAKANGLSTEEYQAKARSNFEAFATALDMTAAKLTGNTEAANKIYDSYLENVGKSTDNMVSSVTGGMDNIASAISASTEAIALAGESVSETFANMDTNVSDSALGITGSVGSIADKVAEVGQSVVTNVNTDTTQATKDATTQWDNARLTLGKTWDLINSNNNSTFDTIENNTRQNTADTTSNTTAQWDATRIGLGETFDLIKQNNITAFTEMKDSDIDLMEQNGEGLKEPIGVIVSGIESVAQSVTDGINAQIDAINAATTFSWTNPLTKESFSSSGLGISKVVFAGLSAAKASIPKLATGTVVPRQAGEFAAILGDNNRETEVVSPLSTIQEAVANVMGEYLPYLEQLVDNTREIADKDMSVNIGDRDIADAARRGEKELGFRLAY